MHTLSTENIRRKRLSYAVSMALASLVAGNMAMAQEAPKTEAAAAPADAVVNKVLVVGTRASQQSGIERKKNAATAMDSIVAEDVGAFPDRNVGEAISRIAGVAIERGDFGEGSSVAIRGNSAELTRVEIDGQGVQSGGGTDLNPAGNTSGRGVEFRELSADLIKSVDIVKGSTPDMTEGSLGGGVIIKTRSSLDFKKPFYSLRLAASQGSLNKKWSPDANLILTDKFLDGRLGAMLNYSTSSVRNESHSSQVATNGTQGYARLIDFDNSPNKTFTFQPQTVNAADPASSTPLVASTLAGTAGGTFNSATPLELVTKSAAAKTKADCYAAFPALTTAQQNLITSGTQRTNAIVQRGNELLTCLNQWNDYTPSLLRYFEKEQTDMRRSLDLRTDFKVNNELTIYAKVNFAKRHIDDNQLTYGLGGLNLNTAVAQSPTYLGPTFTDSTTGVRSAVPGSGYYLYDTPSFRTGLFPSVGTVANVAPGSVVVDANHHVTQMTITDGNANTDQIHNIIETSTTYMQTGGTYRNGGLLIEYMVGDAKADFRRGDKRTNWSVNYGPTTMSVLPNGLWTYQTPSTSSFDQANPALYAIANPASAALVANPLSANNTRATPAYTIAQQPLLTQAPQITFSPYIRETDEKTAKIDASYALSDEIPFFKRIKTGLNARDATGSNWGGGGFVAQTATGTFGTAGYVPAVVIPSANVRSFFQGCTNTAGSLAAGGAACNYGFVPNSNPGAATVQSGTTVMTQQQFLDIITQSMTKPNTPFFAGAPDRPAGLINGWQQIDVEKVFALVGTPNINFNCVKECVGSDGKTYQQPVTKYRERTLAGYAMTDFGLENLPFTNKPLPFNMEFEGNFGWRVVRTKVEGTGNMTLTSITKNASFDPLNPNAAAGVNTNTYIQPTSLSASTTDYLPILNLALWAVPDQLVLRYNHSKAVARPPVQSLLPAGTCTFDQRRDESDLAQGCGTTAIGNPAIRPQTNINQNLSVEWYPNRDTMFSLGGFKQEGIIGAATTVGVQGGKVFNSSGFTDPITGKALSNLDFNYTTWANGAATTRKGVEFASKTAFTFLPWKLRYTGMDVNYTKLRSATSSVNVVDLLTGDALPPVRESKYSYNASLWYDDGAFSARVALQSIASYFNCIASCVNNTVNNYPNTSTTAARPAPYNPGSPNFRDSVRYVDAKLAYKFKNGIELFVEGRNLGLTTTSNSQGIYSVFANGTPSILDYAYAGRRIMMGVNIKN